jgi:3',5'-cyclic AMP phosphodiesterase CpdA
MREAKLVLSAFGYGEKHLTVVPGNHDVVNFQGVAEFRSVMEQPSWPHLSWISDDLVVLALDSTVHGLDLDWRDALGMNARGMFSEASVEEAERLLRSLPKETFKVLCCHHHLVDLPPDGYVDEWSGKLDPRQAGPAQRAGDILDLAQKYGAGLLLFGHRHRATHHLFTIRGIPAACSGSVTELDHQGRLRYRIFDFDGPRIRRRRWIDAFPQNASREVVMQALHGVSSAQEGTEWTLTEPLSARRDDRDTARLIEKIKAIDHRVIELVRRRLDAERRRGS